MNNKANNRVRELRLKKNMTQEELAQALDLSRQAIITIEQEGCDPSICHALKIAKFFDLAVEKVFSLPKQV